MHRTQADGFETVGGKTLFQDTEPEGTLAEADDFNATQEEICQAVEASGQALNTQAQDFGTGDFDDANQLLQGILSLSGRHPTLVPVTPDIENGVLIGGPSAPETRIVNAAIFTAVDLFHQISLTESGGPFDNGVVLLQEGSAYPGRSIFITNNTGTKKRIRSENDVPNGNGDNSNDITIFPGYSAQFICIQTTARWRAVRSIPNRRSFSLALFDGNTQLASGTAIWERDPLTQTIRLHIPELSGVIVTGTAVRLAAPGGTPQPVPQLLSRDTATTARFPLCIVDIAAAAVKPWRWNGNDYYESDVVVPAGAFTVREQTIQYSR